jgi:serine/threonine protein kinase/Tfp pilus assembly protein PilF
MSSFSESSTASVETLLGQAADEFTERLNRGEQPDIEEFARLHPEIAELLRQVLPALQVMAPPSSQPSHDFVEERTALDGFLGDYRVGKEIGRGGMGIVYEAEQISLRRRVALKVLPFAATLEPKRLQRFRNEAQAAAQLHHPNIVPIFAVGSERSVHFYAMQLIEGHSLAAVIEGLQKQAAPEVKQHQIAESSITPPGKPSEAPLGVAGSTQILAALSTQRSTRSKDFFRTIAELGVQAAVALDYAHEMGVIHRDIKPANLILDSGRNLWITDFGLAQIKTDAGLTMTGDLVGTIRYMSPEQALGQRVTLDHRTDIYSLGATLYELLTLKAAVSGNDREELLRRIASEVPCSVRRLNKAVPAELETIVAKAIEKNPSDRYATAQEFAADLQRWLEDKPIRARRPGLVLRSRKWARRHRALTASALAVLIAAGLVLAVSLVAVSGLYRELDKQNDQLKQSLADEQEQRARAEASTLQARESEADTDAYSVFLANVLAEARPKGQAGGMGIKITMREALDAALPKVEKMFLGRPRAEARARLTLGDTYHFLGEYKIAIRELERARDLHLQSLGPRHTLTLQNCSVLASVYEIIGDFKKAEPLMKEVLKIRLETLGPTDSFTLRSKNNLGCLYQHAGKLPEAEAIFEETLILMKENLGPTNEFTLSCQGNLGYVYTDSGKLEKAIPLLKENLSIQQQAHGPTNPATLTSMHNLARAYQRAHRVEQAMPLFHEVLNSRKEVLGPTHPGTRLTMTLLAIAYEEAGQPGKATLLQEELLKLCEDNLGPTDPETLQCMVNLGRWYSNWGRSEQGIAIHKKALELCTGRLGRMDRLTLHCMNNLATDYKLAGQHGNAVKLFEELMKLSKVSLGPTNSLTLGFQGNSADAYLRDGQLEKALELYKEAANLGKKSLGPTDPHTLRFMDGVAYAYQRLGQADKAVPLLEELLEIRKRVYSLNRLETVNTMVGLGRAYVANGNHEKAEQLFREYLTLREKSNPDSWMVFDACSMLGSSLTEQHRFKEAEALLLKGYEGMQARSDQIPANLKKNRTESIDRLVKLYDAWGKPDKARIWRQRLEAATKPGKQAGSK